MSERLPVIYIAGVARSGTSWVGQVFNSNPRVVYRFQPFFSYEFQGRLDEDSSAECFRTVFSELRAADTPFLTQRDKVLSGQYPAFAKDKTADLLVFKENRYQYLVPHALRKVDELSVLAVVRNPCAVLQSWRKNAKEFPEGSDFLKEWRHGMCKNSGPQDCFGYYRWKETANMYLDLHAQFPDRVFLLRFEDAVMNPEAVFAEIFEFFSLPMTGATRQFLEDCTTTHSSDYYSVYKDRSVVDDWRRGLEAEVSREIADDLAGTRLERFLHGPA